MFYSGQYSGGCGVLYKFPGLIMNLYQQERSESYRWSLAAVITFFCAFFMVSLLLSACQNPYEIAKRKYATDVVDTTYTNIITTIPRDSVIKVFKTEFKSDTVRVIEKVRQGRASVTIIREPTNTTVIANCDSVSKSQKVITKIVKQQWGVDPKYKQRASTWQTVAIVFIGLFVAGIAVWYFTHRFKLAVHKR